MKGITISTAIKTLATAALIAAVSPVTAHDSTDHDTGLKSSKPAGANHDLASQATNPAAALIQLQLQNVFRPESYNSSGYANTFIVQPVIPFALGKDKYFQNLIVRPTIPLAVTTPDPDGREAQTTALGDTTILAALAHKQKVSDTFGYEWAPMGTIVLPTSTDDRTGGDNIAMGPGFLVIGAKKGWLTKGDIFQFGFYGYNIWDVASDNDDVSTLFVGPLATYHFAKLFDQPGWYLRWTDELMNWDWEDKAPDGKASIPVGAALGRVFAIGKQPVNIFLASDYYAEHRGTDSKWDIKLNVTFLFPE
jgi:hypothetical protein